MIKQADGNRERRQMAIEKADSINSNKDSNNADTIHETVRQVNDKCDRHRDKQPQ